MDEELLTRISDAYRAFMEEKMSDRPDPDRFKKVYLALFAVVEECDLIRRGRDAIKLGDFTGDLAQKKYHTGYRGKREE